MDDLKNLYVIKQRLADLKPMVWSYQNNQTKEYKYYCGNFVVNISTNSSDLNDRITKHFFLSVYVAELNHSGNEMPISIVNDVRFNTYDPIKCDTNAQMPILTLCELVKYLHRLEKIAIFT